MLAVNEAARSAVAAKLALRAGMAPGAPSSIPQAILALADKAAMAESSNTGAAIYSKPAPSPNLPAIAGQ